MLLALCSSNLKVSQVAFRWGKAIISTIPIPVPVITASDTRHTRYGPLLQLVRPYYQNNIVQSSSYTFHLLLGDNSTASCNVPFICSTTSCDRELTFKQYDTDIPSPLSHAAIRHAMERLLNTRASTGNNKTNT